MHIQIIVSRKDLTNKIKLSPMNNSRGSNEKHSAKLGQFNRLAFKEWGELLFDEMFAYKRSLKETIDYSLLMKNGNVEQKRTAGLCTGSNRRSCLILKKNPLLKQLKSNDFELDHFLNVFDFSTAGLFNIFSTDPLNMTKPPPFLTLKRRKENDEGGYLLLQNKPKNKRILNLVTFHRS